MFDSHHRIALVADLHGHADILARALKICEMEQAEAIVFLGDMIDRDDQADACVSLLSGWRATGVYGNHERQMVAALTMGADLGLLPETIEFFTGLEERITVGDVCFVHDEMELPRHHPALDFFNRESSGNVILREQSDREISELQGEISRFARNDKSNGSHYRILFVGHTHHRAAVSDNGPLDLAHGIVLDPNRKYVVNPGALVGGQFAIWDRAENVVEFKQVK